MEYKGIIVLIMILSLAVIIPHSFAYDSQSDLLSGNDTSVQITDYYFDSNVDVDGNGSINSPYKYLTDDKIKDNSALHFANGEYNFSSSKKPYNVSLIGSDVGDTNIIVKGSVEFNQNVLLKNITFTGAQFFARGVFNASNVVFKDSSARVSGGYDNSYGGAIYAPSGNYKVYVDNCTFINNYAQYGGAIYMYGGILEVKNSKFIDNYAYNYGGAIACEYNSRAEIKNSNFTKSKSLNDAGGAIYLKSSSFTAEGLNILNSNATFGAAITSIFTDSNLKNIYLENNTAKYDGGGYYQVSGKLTIYNSSFIKNNANNGAGLYAGRCENITVSNTLFSNNKAISSAGAFYSILNSDLNTDNITYENNDFYNFDDLNPFISNINYALYSYNSTFNGEIPSRFMLDNLNVKDQQDGGICYNSQS